jgi:PD-(D/E)XK nuclease superfamily
VQLTHPTEWVIYFLVLAKKMQDSQVPILRLSQGHLNLLELCPRKFQHTFLEKLSSPSIPEYEEKQKLGSRFHLLMQQQEMGLPINNFLQEDEKLGQLMTAFAKAAPEILAPNITPNNSEAFRESEHYRTLQIKNYLLTVIYDLLIADNHQAQILDWKTYANPPSRRNLEQDWQTLLYMFVLAETSDYLPENISMTYWFVQSKDKPQSMKFTYSTSQHEKIRKKLTQLLTRLSNYLENYYQSQEFEFPQIPENSKTCKNCNYFTRCYGDYTVANLDGSDSTNRIDANLLNVANIQEVSL